MARSNSANGGANYFDLVIQVVEAADDHYTLRAVVYLQSYNVIDSNNNLSIGGNWGRSGALALNGVYNYVPVWYSDIQVNRQYGANVGVSVSASWSGVEYWGVTLSASESYTVPARPYSVPAAPTGIAVARNSDTSHTVTWTNHPTTAAPVTVNRVYRSTDNGGWALIAEIPAAGGFTDTTTSANHRYRYTVHAVNSAGATAETSGGAYIQTVPAAPTAVLASKTAGSDIQITWSDQAQASMVLTWTIEHSTDGGSSWSTLVSGIARGTTSYLHSAPNPAQTHRYRVRAVSTVGVALSSAAVTSNTVQLLTAPNAPTGLGPSTVGDATEDRVLVWTHNPVDSTPQTKFQIRHRNVGGSWTTEAAVTSGVSSWTLAGGTYANPDGVEWEVRTWGLATSGGSDGTGASDWSATASFSTSTRPTTTINSPEADHNLSTLTVEWTYYDAESTDQSAWAVELVSGTAVVESRSDAGTAQSVDLNTRLPDGSTWTVRVRTQDGSGLWSQWDEQVVTVTYALPPAPVIGLSWNSVNGTVNIAVSNPAPDEDEVATDHVDLYRSVDGGPYEVFAVGVPTDTTVIDWAPTVAGINTYRVVAVSALPSTSDVEQEITTSDTKAIFISGGPGFSQMCKATRELGIETTHGRAEKVRRQYAGHDYPVAHRGTSRSNILSFEAILIPALSDPYSTPEQWDALDLDAGPFLWRDASGRRVVVDLDQVRLTRLRNGSTQLSVTATQISRQGN